MRNSEKNQFEKLFNELYEKYNKLVFSIAIQRLGSHNLAEDCVQETFLTVAQKFDKFKDLDESHRRNLICTIAKGKAVDSIRKEKVFDLSENIENVNISSFDAFEALEIAEEIGKLTEFEQAYIFLKYSYGFSNVEISKMYSLSASYVGRVINNALTEIKNNLEGK